MQHQISVRRGPLFFKTASAESLSCTSRAASMMSRVQGNNYYHFYHPNASESEMKVKVKASTMSRVQGNNFLQFYHPNESESENVNVKASTVSWVQGNKWKWCLREEIQELDMIDLSTGGDPFLMCLVQGRSEFAWLELFSSLIQKQILFYIQELFGGECLLLR